MYIFKCKNPSSTDVYYTHRYKVVVFQSDDVTHYHCVPGDCGELALAQHFRLPVVDFRVAAMPYLIKKWRLIQNGVYYVGQSPVQFVCVCTHMLVLAHNSTGCYSASPLNCHPAVLEQPMHPYNGPIHLVFIKSKHVVLTKSSTASLAAVSISTRTRGITVVI